MALDLEHTEGQAAGGWVPTGSKAKKNVNTKYGGVSSGKREGRIHHRSIHGLIFSNMQEDKEITLAEEMAWLLACGNCWYSVLGAESKITWDFS